MIRTAEALGLLHVHVVPCAEPAPNVQVRGIGLRGAEAHVLAAYDISVCVCVCVCVRACV